MIIYRLQFFKSGPLPQTYYWIPTLSLWKHRLYTAPFFHCRFYQGFRSTLLNACTTYKNPSLNRLLFCSSTLSLEANIAILEHVYVRYQSLPISCLQNLLEFNAFVLQILSGNRILTYIKGHNCIIYKQLRPRYCQYLCINKSLVKSF